MPPVALPAHSAVAPVEKTAVPRSKGVHLALAGLSFVLLLFCVVGAPAGALHAAIPSIEAVLLLTPPLLVPAAFLHERKAVERRDAILMLPWILLIALLMVQAAPTAATFGYPLRDELWRKFDEHLGINVPAIMDWARRHPAIESLLFDFYAFALHPMLLAAIFLPTLLGKREVAQRFALTNAFSFVLALPLMLFFPAVGPWVAWHFAPDKLQQACEATIFALRHGSLLVRDSFGGIVCLPSYHVFWAAVAAYALYPFRYLRYPAIAVAALISISTLTTGWHYGIDVIAGLAMMAVCSCLADIVIHGRLPFRASDVPEFDTSCTTSETVAMRSRACE
jgi:membrane-associated phospholipid phosphatase